MINGSQNSPIIFFNTKAKIKCSIYMLAAAGLPRATKTWLPPRMTPTCWRGHKLRLPGPVSRRPAVLTGGGEDGAREGREGRQGKRLAATAQAFAERGSLSYSQPGQALP